MSGNRSSRPRHAPGVSLAYPSRLTLRFVEVILTGFTEKQTVQYSSEESVPDTVELDTFTMGDPKAEIIIYDGTKTGKLAHSDGPVTARNAPSIVKAAGKAAEFAWKEFFQAEIANAHTRKNYRHAVRPFLAWAEGRGLELPHVSPGDLGEYLQGLELAIPTKKLHPAAPLRFFDRLVNRHACVINPAATVKTERYEVVEGKTPEIGPGPARTLLKSIDGLDPVGLRDRAVLALLICTAARVGAAAKLTSKGVKHDGMQYALRLSEKVGKTREIPVRHDQEWSLLDYVRATGIADGPSSARRTVGRTRPPSTR